MLKGDKIWPIVAAVAEVDMALQCRKGLKDDKQKMNPKLGEGEVAWKVGGGV